VSLDALIGSLHAALEGVRDHDRHTIETALVWCKVERGDLGEAFQLMWEPAQASDLDHARRLTRAELQAYCGNEDAALALIRELAEDIAAPAIVRARVAASRGDWESASHYALQAAETQSGDPRALQLAARAKIELGHVEEAQRLLDQVVQETSVDALAVEALRARLSETDPIGALTRAAERAERQGAMRVCADAWADVSSLCGACGQPEEMKRAAVRAVELWDDMATSLPPPLRSGFWRDARRRTTRESSRSPNTSEGARTATGLAPLLATMRRLASERDLEKLLMAITDGAVSLSGAERGFVLLVDEQGGFETKTMRSAEEQLGAKTASFSRSIAETVLIDGDPVITVDAAHDARVQDYMSVHRLMLKSVACLRIESRGRVWGVLYLEHRSASGRFAGTDLSLLRAYADQAAIAIETSDLIGRIEAQKQHLERTNRALREANERLEQRFHGQTEVLQRTLQQIARLQARSAEGERWGIVGESEGMRRVYELLDRVAARALPVALTGESGTGKELLARAIHRASERSNLPYVALNCGAIPEGLLESELFGHVAGAFTGATHPREGVFSQAHGGTLFMDEIADMPARMQLDLLRVLEERRVRPVGGDVERPIDVRLITASKRPLRELVDEGTLREDLYYRLAVVEIRLPPLRDRRSDIPLLCDHFLDRVAKERGEPRKRLSRGAMQRLCEHDFPGNVRELENILERAMTLSNAGQIDVSDLQLRADDDETAPHAGGDTTLGSQLEEIERDAIVKALEQARYNKTAAAKALGMSFRALRYRIKKLGIE